MGAEYSLHKSCFMLLFFFDPLRSVGISQILCMVSEI